MPKLRLSFLAWLVSTLVMTLAAPELIFLYRIGLHLRHLFPEPFVDFIDALAHMRFPVPLMYASNWFLFYIAFGLPITAVGLGQRWVLNRIGRTDYLSCAAMCALTAGLPFLLIMAPLMVWHTPTNFSWVLPVLRVTGSFTLWLAPFGILQGIAYRAIAGAEPGKPPRVVPSDVFAAPSAA